MDEIRWGIVGPGRIAESVIGDFRHVPAALPVAVGSRSIERARAFADKHRLERAYGSYDELINDDDVDALYIATPHPQHLHPALAAIKAGKAVLIEKTFTATVAGAEEIIQAARDQEVFVMEAMWTRFQPAIVAARNSSPTGRSAKCDRSMPIWGSTRRTIPRTGCSIPILAAARCSISGCMWCRSPSTSSATRIGWRSAAPRHPQEWTPKLGCYSATRTGAPPHCSSRSETRRPGMARIHGTEGWIEVPPRFHHPNHIVLQRTGAEPEVISRPPSGTGYSHELIEVTECLLDGRTESEVMPLDDTLAVQRILNGACESLVSITTRRQHSGDPRRPGRG